MIRTVFGVVVLLCGCVPEPSRSCELGHTMACDDGGVRVCGRGGMWLDCVGPGGPDGGDLSDADMPDSDVPGSASDAGLPVCVCDADFDRNGVTDLDDLFAVNDRIGCATATDTSCRPYDLNCDGVVDDCDDDATACLFEGGGTECCESCE